MRYVPTTFSVAYRSRWFGYRFGEDKSQIRDGNGGSYKARQSERGAQAAFGTRRLRLRSSLTLLESFGRKAAALCHLVESSIALTTSTLEIRQREPPVIKRRSATQQVRHALQERVPTRIASAGGLVHHT